MPGAPELEAWARQYATPVSSCYSQQLRDEPDLFRTGTYELSLEGGEVIAAELVGGPDHPLHDCVTDRMLRWRLPDDLTATLRVLVVYGS